jgi:hypothetical protein
MALPRGAAASPRRDGVHCDGFDLKKLEANWLLPEDAVALAIAISALNQAVLYSGSTRFGAIGPRGVRPLARFLVT